jgi:hypothetical protein
LEFSDRLSLSLKLLKVWRGPARLIIAASIMATTSAAAADAFSLFVSENTCPQRTQSAAAVHKSICSLVEAQAAVDPSWAAWREVFLSVEETVAALLPPQAVDKKRKATAGQGGGRLAGTADEGNANVTDVPTHVSLSVKSLDGQVLPLHVPRDTRVRELKDMVARSRGVAVATIELFVAGVEHALPEEARLDVLDIGDEAVVFLLLRPGWCWLQAGNDVTISEDGQDATRKFDSTEFEDDSFVGGLVTGGEPMTEGRHYWETEIAACGVNCAICFGCVRPDCDHNLDYCVRGAAHAHLIYAADGALYGSGKDYGGLVTGRSRQFAAGDRIGVLLDLDAGWVRFYRNGKRCGPGFTEGVTGPLLRAAELYQTGNRATAVPGAVAPEGAGDADEPWDEPEPESEADY